MPYTYFLSGSNLLTNPNRVLIDGFQAGLDEYFSVASDVFTIREETYFASGSFQTLQARINDAVDNLTGLKLGDDFKKILFQDIEHNCQLGIKYFFDGSYWLTVNVDKIKGISQSCLVRRCNNVLRWADSNNNILSEHCIIDYKINTPDNRARTDPITPEGTITVYAALNSRTNTIHENQRFLFGNSSNWSCYKVFGGGVSNYLNTQTSNNDSVRLLTLSMGKNFVNEETDDLTNGIADRYKNFYSIVISPSSILGGIGDSFLLNTVVYLNSTPVEKQVYYNTNNSSVATISASVVSLIGSGSCIITGCMLDNMSITDTVAVTVSASVVENDVRFSPNKTYVLQGDVETFDCYYYENNVQQSGSFLFSIANNNVPAANYVLTTLGTNSFSVENLKLYLDYPLVINATSGSISGQLNLALRGAW